MECSICENDINYGDIYFQCPNCDAVFCEDEEESINVQGGLCPLCERGFIEEQTCGE